MVSGADSAGCQEQSCTVSERSRGWLSAVGSAWFVPVSRLAEFLLGQLIRM